jgi:hypothetical protein
LRAQPLRQSIAQGAQARQGVCAQEHDQAKNE